MYCRNCGNQIQPGATFCTNCGVAVNTGNNHCPNCGNKTDPQAVVCVNCGFALGAPQGYPGQAPGQGFQGSPGQPYPQQKSKLAAGLLGIFLGSLGIHNFYLGYTNKGVIQLVLGIFSCGLISSIWALVEAIMIFTGSINCDAQGIPLKE